MTYNNSARIAARRTLRPLATVAVAALIGSGCLTLATHAGADPGSGAQAANYSACMRANGVADFPDPNADGRIRYGGISVTKETWAKAVDVCQDVAPPDWNDTGRTPEQQGAALEFAQCMRDNGVPDFPDPATARDPLIDTSNMRGGVSARDIPELKGAHEACRDSFAAALPRAGRPG